jgi:hypothetical protein
MNVTLFVPVYKSSQKIEKILCTDFISRASLSIFDDLSINFLSTLSKKILETNGIKNYPELVALAYWLRKANLSSIINSFKNKIEDCEIITPRGLAFHIAPANVDSIFLYSWALSLLIGNLNVVRISHKINEQLSLLLKILQEIFQDDKWLPIAERNIIITYPKDEKINTFISEKSDVRILWGGDETIKSIRTLPTKSATKDILFADKFSYTVVNSKKYFSLSDVEKAKVAKAFYNDSYWFEQMACSSPRFVIFIGDEDECKASSEIFWKFLEEELHKKSIIDSLDIAMEKLVYEFESISQTTLRQKADLPKSVKPAVLKVKIEELTKFRETCGGGFFFECFVNNLNFLSKYVSYKDQTLTYYGFSKEELKDFALRVNGAGIDRIVPIGQALNFSPIWDGYSLFYELSKHVSIII